MHFYGVLTGLALSIMGDLFVLNKQKGGGKFCIVTAYCGRHEYMQGSLGLIIHLYGIVTGIVFKTHGDTFEEYKMRLLSTNICQTKCKTIMRK